MAEATGTQSGANPAGQAGSSHGGLHLPAKGACLKLVPSDFVSAGKEMGVEAAAVHAVASVESGGRTGFESQLPKIRYENHWFQRFTKHAYDKKYPHLSCAYKSKQYKLTHASGGNLGQWKLLREAFALNSSAAVRACSWGMFQVMGDNYKNIGWKDLQAFIDAMYQSEGQHLRAFMGFCRANNLIRYLKNHQWTSFAKSYNGPSYADNAYDVKMKQAYLRYK